ncbi:hypothetical protein RRG08_055369 [Elysia crispata]|uniref:Uncharacterized protein n=1 Tax=Elysia crispata TaxID=231223 RepID=A0AAE1ASS2_9GAST|nr:hypothetical protein RRG08_055369 [Elysia crispata]
MELWQSLIVWPADTEKDNICMELYQGLIVCPADSEKGNICMELYQGLIVCPADSEKGNICMELYQGLIVCPADSEKGNICKDLSFPVETQLSNLKTFTPANSNEPQIETMCPQVAHVACIMSSSCPCRLHYDLKLPMSPVL